jgi:hypothetical protein
MTCLVFSYDGFAQAGKNIFRKRKLDVDSNYVKPYAEELTGRVFLSKKYTSILVPGNSTAPSFTYQPNTTLNAGIGATYRSLTLNLAYGLPLLNAGTQERGKTKYLDLQGHFYARKFAVDFLGQFYKGYYISADNFVPGYQGYYYRPDLKVRLVGLSSYFVFNNKKFSYRASMMQNERQTKSAGTFLLGGEIYYGTIKSDSTLVPSQISEEYPQGIVNRMRFIKIGAGAGYAYTYVYKEHLFATASFTANLPLNFVREDVLDGGKKHNVNVAPNYAFRLAVGYNSRRWIYTASWVNNTITMKGGFNDGIYRMNTGNYRLTVAKRFTLSHKTKKALQPAVDIINAPKKLTQ